MSTNETTALNVDIVSANDSDASSSTKATPLLKEEVYPMLALSPNTLNHIRPKTRSYRSSQNRSHTFRCVQRVSRNAVLTTKKQLWDSNEVSISAALSAVNQWERSYVAVRGFAVGSTQKLEDVYRAVKSSIGELKHGVLKPIRNWILLPALYGIELAVVKSICLVQTHRDRALQECHHLAQSVPFVGNTILSPALYWSAELFKRSWNILQYPIPSRHQVIQTVDSALTCTKWFLSVGGREIVLCIKRIDAVVTRALSTAQWKVLGSGPYVTLNPKARSEVLDHLCERYFSILNPMARYEVAAHIRHHNPPLYTDLVSTGVLQDRGGDLTLYDEWLCENPIYHDLESPFLLDLSASMLEKNTKNCVSPIWFRHPNVNGKKQGKDSQWIPFCRSEGASLESRYVQLVGLGKNADEECGSLFPLLGVINQNNLDDYRKTRNSTEVTRKSTTCQTYPTVAQWYDPDLEYDVFVDQMRAAVSFHQACSHCYSPLGDGKALCSPSYLHRDALCKICTSTTSSSSQLSSSCADSYALRPPPLSMLLRPTCWRFHGPGDTVRRAVWLLDTARYGLQPFDDISSGILEDAYLFLKWTSLRQDSQFEDAEVSDTQGSPTTPVILTIEVRCPDDLDRLVQFTSLTRATAVQKGFEGSISLFKRRVYRGAQLLEIPNEQCHDKDFSPVEKSLFQEMAKHGPLGETIVPNTSIRSALTIASSKPIPYELQSQPTENHLSCPSLAASLEHLDEAIRKYLRDEEDTKVDHLVLVVHGIGEMLRTIDLFGLPFSNFSSIIDCCAFLRKNHAEVKVTELWNSNLSSSGLSSLASRVEYLPIEWHEAFTILSQRRSHPNDYITATSTTNTINSRNGSSIRNNRRTKKRCNRVMVEDISLRTITSMREFANDTLLDLLYFMSPEHHDVIIDIVTCEMNSVVDRYRRLIGFKGRISIVGHSLGSVIMWDILSNQRKIDLKLSVHEALQSLTYPPLNFKVDNFFLLGSPVAVFLMIRNQRQPLSESFILPGCNRVFNIFHPYDPVAYRLEPCIDPRNTDFEPIIMTHWNGGFRVHYQTRRLWRKFIDAMRKTQQNVFKTFEASMTGLGLVDSTEHYVVDDDDEMSSSESSVDSRSHGVIAGALNEGRRIDYMLQEKEIENASEYVAALAAHSSYWTEKDLSLFIERQISLSETLIGINSSYSCDALDSLASEI